MPATFSGAVSPTAPAVVDTNITQGTGSTSAGIGPLPADGISVGASRIGGAPGTDLRAETGDGVGV